MIQKQVILTFIKNSYIKHNKHEKKNIESTFENVHQNSLVKYWLWLQMIFLFLFFKVHIFLLLSEIKQALTSWVHCSMGTVPL